MRIPAAVVVVSFAAIVCCGTLAEGQKREKPADTQQKRPDAVGKSAPADAKRGEAAKQKKESAKTSSRRANDQATAADEVADEKKIRASAEAFTRLYNEHDAKGLAALFAPKAELIDEDGNAVKGREEIEKAFADVFQQHPQASMEVEVESVKLMSMLAIEEGTARSKNAPDEPESVTAYIAIHVKIDSKWELACVRDWDAPADELSPHEQLEQSLSWLIGDWIDEGHDSVVHTTCNWHDNGNFLLQEFQVNVGGEIAMSGTVRIGFNAVANQFQSWVFDSHGGHSSGLWFRDGDRWLVRMQGATAKGEVGSSTNYYRPIDDDTIAWGSYDRVVDGERLDDIAELVVKRRAPSPTE
jgi:uncharacterized protein (TIGR02246 family)